MRSGGKRGGKEVWKSEEVWKCGSVKERGGRKNRRSKEKRVRCGRVRRCGMEGSGNGEMELRDGIDRWN